MKQKILLSSSHLQKRDVAACPGSGKTTVLLAKLKLLADRMPFQNGSGVCVLSHTNVAVNEIKTKLSDYADILMSYPNYVGTIQSFIDQFVTKPYLKQKTDIGIQVVEDSVYAQHLYKLLWKDKSKNSPYQKLRYFIKYNVKNGSGQYDNEVSYMENLYQKNGALYVSKQKKPLAGADAPSAKQYEAAVQELLTLEGLIRYNDAYQYAVESVRELSTEYTDLFCRRFQYVFIDEYQDCNQMQRDALDKLFNRNKCCVFHIGDSDQAIYNSDNCEIEDWKPSASCLSMVSSNRYGQEIADVLTNLRTDKKVINASSGKTGYIPTVIIFDDASIDKVVEKYILALDENELYDPNGIYKIIGAVKKRDLTGLKIGDYWSEYDDNNNLSRKIEIDTVHGVKGETHDATLYLETEKNRSSDIRRILPYWGIGKKGSQAISEYSRKCVYVGMSRPRKLLCLAVRAETYEEGKKVFQTWKVIDCRAKD